MQREGGGKKKHSQKAKKQQNNTVAATTNTIEIVSVSDVPVVSTSKSITVSLYAVSVNSAR